MDYCCSLCKAEGVKLWGFEGNSGTFLICASCAERRQVQQFYHKHIWIKKGERTYFGVPSVRKFPMPRWEVNRKGRIPTNTGFGPDGEPFSYTDVLLINVHDICSELTEVEAFPEFPEDKTFNEWRNLPTR